METLLDTGLALVIAVVSAIVTVILSLARFRSEKWWERKADVYSELVRALAVCQLSLTEWISHTISEKRLGESYLSAIGKEYRTAVHQLRKAAAMGAYVISERAATVLGEMAKELDHPTHENLLDDLELDESAVTKALRDLREEARKDLAQPRVPS